MMKTLSLLICLLAFQCSSFCQSFKRVDEFFFYNDDSTNLQKGGFKIFSDGKLVEEKITDRVDCTDWTGPIYAHHLYLYLDSMKIEDVHVANVSVTRKMFIYDSSRSTHKMRIASTLETSYSKIFGTSDSEVNRELYFYLKDALVEIRHLRITPGNLEHWLSVFYDYDSLNRIRQEKRVIFYAFDSSSDTSILKYDYFKGMTVEKEYLRNGRGIFYDTTVYDKNGRVVRQVLFQDAGYPTHYAESKHTYDSDGYLLRTVMTCGYTFKRSKKTIIYKYKK